ncbi:hypothetical protein [Flocculibacter collagenilyticus]|uniref:hypothetical protein n=1 Tax=Flocculibacter collagenilyticus TaxID=2744479 RepID=UPI0018F6F2FC|nr:hypothetical protein [Flocculibacter collagenilyticus]
MTNLDKDEVIEKFTTAYVAANGKQPDLEVKSGWYSVDGGKNMRLADLNELADELSTTYAEDVTEPVADTRTNMGKKAKPKKATKAKSAAKTKKKSSKSGGLTAEALWQKQLEEKDHQCTLPRGIR